MTCALPLLKVMAVDCTGSRNRVFNLMSTGPDFLLAVGSHEAGLPMWPSALSSHLWQLSLVACGTASLYFTNPQQRGRGKEISFPNIAAQLCARSLLPSWRLQPD